MTTKEIVRQEGRRLAWGVCVLTAAAFALLALLGHGTARNGCSLLIGAAYTLLQFHMLGANAARALLFTPEQAERILRRGYLTRYLLTIGMLALTVYLGLSPLVAVLPLLFPKVILFVGNVFPGKGGKA